MPEHAHPVVIVGAGPAGLAAARAAIESGARALVLDAHDAPGGQVWRRRHDGTHPAPAAQALAILAHPACTWLPAHRVVARDGDALLVQSPQGTSRLPFQRLVLATGARELLLPFPGWTLPGVTGAGGLQALVKGGWPIAGRRVVVAGSGPLLLAAADTVRAAGARVLAIAEEADAAGLARFALSLWRYPAKARQAIALRARLRATPYLPDTHVVRAIGDERVEAVVLADRHGERELACDALAVGHGLVPNVELATLLDCAIDRGAMHPVIAVDALQRTSVPAILAAGEGTGIGGVDRSLAEGCIAGHVAAGDEVRARRAHAARAQAHRFARSLARTFAVPPDYAQRIAPDTLVCRCEDVSWRTLVQADGTPVHADARARKLDTRVGMGWCQGRICGAALAALGVAPDVGVRPPLYPVRIGSMIDL